MEEKSKSFHEQIHSQIFLDKEKQIDNGMAELDLKHSEFLDTVVGRTLGIPNKRRATLKQYVYFAYGANRIEFGIVDDNKELPFHIKQEIESIYLNAFPELKKH